MPPKAIIANDNDADKKEPRVKLEEFNKYLVEMYGQRRKETLRGVVENGLMDIVEDKEIPNDEKFVTMMEMFNAYVQVSKGDGIPYKADGHQMHLIGAVCSAVSDIEQKAAINALMSNEEHMCRRGFKWLVSQGIMGTGVATFKPNSNNKRARVDDNGDSSSSLSSTSSLTGVENKRLDRLEAEFKEINRKMVQHKKIFDIFIGTCAEIKSIYDNIQPNIEEFNSIGNKQQQHEGYFHKWGQCIKSLVSINEAINELRNSIIEHQKKIDPSSSSSSSSSS